MSGARQVDERRYGLFALATVVMVAGLTVMFIWRKDFLLNSVGLVLSVVGVYLVRVSKVRGLRDVVARRRKCGEFVVPNHPISTKGNRPRPIILAVGIILLVVAGISYYLLREDAARGGHQAWPAYAFAVAVMVCGSFWTYLITKWLWLN